MADDAALYAEGEGVAALPLGAQAMKHTVGGLILGSELEQDFLPRAPRVHGGLQGDPEGIRAAGAKTHQLPLLEARGEAPKRALIEGAEGALGCKGAALGFSVSRPQDGLRGKAGIEFHHAAALA